MQSRSAIGTDFPKAAIRHRAQPTRAPCATAASPTPSPESHLARSNPHSTTPLLTASARPRFRPLGVARLPPPTPPQHRRPTLARAGVRQPLPVAVVGIGRFCCSLSSKLSTRRRSDYTALSVRLGLQYQ